MSRITRSKSKASSSNLWVALENSTVASTSRPATPPDSGPSRATAAPGPVPSAPSTPLGYRSSTPSTPTSSTTVSSLPSVEDTPMGFNAHGSDQGYDIVRDLRLAMHAELSAHATNGGEAYSSAIFQGIQSEEAIRTFVDKGQFYSNRTKRWKSIGSKLAIEQPLYEPFRRIFQVIFNKFAPRMRKAIDTHSQRLVHMDDVEQILASSPDIVITGWNGRSLPDRAPPDMAKYVHCTAPGDIKTVLNHRPDDRNQIAVYARQCITGQHNRRFVYSFILTEEYIQVFQFDHSGYIYSSPINIHEDPYAFVRIIIGLGSTDEKVLGFDPSIFWEKGQRYLTTMDPNRNSITYRVSEKPTFQRRAIRGRGTCCWTATDDSGREYLVKDSWRSKDRVPEWEYMDDIKGLAGVGQILAWENGEAVSTLRWIPMAPYSNFRDRIFGRITLEKYGNPIDQFSSREQLLYTFRDAVAGHQRLWQKGILHRDISINNILLGLPNAEEGNRGLVIDLDMAIRFDRTSSLAGADFRTGTRAYQSILVLRSQLDGPDAQAHDHLDDLESFFWVLCWICIGYSAPLIRVMPQPGTLTDWEDLEVRRAARFKDSYLKSTIPLLDVNPFFGPIFYTLLEDLRNCLLPRYNEKAGRVFAAAPRTTLSELMPAASSDYTEFLRHIDAAIIALKAQGDTPVNVDPTNLLQPPTASSGSLVLARIPPGSYASSPDALPRGQKRTSTTEDHADGSPVSKKLKQHSYQPAVPSNLSHSHSSGAWDDLE